MKPENFDLNFNPQLSVTIICIASFLFTRNEKSAREDEEVRKKKGKGNECIIGIGEASSIIAVRRGV